MVLRPGFIGAALLIHLSTPPRTHMHIQPMGLSLLSRAMVALSAGLAASGSTIGTRPAAWQIAA